MQEGKVYRVKSAYKDNSTIKQHGWLWVLVRLGGDGYTDEVGWFQSVATGEETPIHFRAVERLSDAGG